MSVKLSLVIPCYNEEETLKACVDRVLSLQGSDLRLEIIIVDDCSTDRSLDTARSLACCHHEIKVLHHDKNQGKGAALRTGFGEASGDFVAVQDADLEYDPMELPNLLDPLRKGEADVVLGSRFAGSGAHRVVYFWHYLGNAFLTFLSNMFTNLNLTDMETCYKVFRREVIQSIEIQENRFGFEPEIVAKIARRGLRIFETGISYHERTYEEGKKIGLRDGFRALYCILRYNAHDAPLPTQFLIYLFIGGISAATDLIVFLCLFRAGLTLTIATVAAFAAAASVNYLLCILILFPLRSAWSSPVEVLLYAILTLSAGALDLGTTSMLWAAGNAPWVAKSAASAVGLVFNFLGRKYFVFPQAARRKPQTAPGNVILQETPVPFPPTNTQL